MTVRRHFRFASIFGAAITLALIAGFICRGTRPNNRTSAAAPQRAASVPFYFEANEGQVDPQARFLSRAGAYTLFLTDDSAILAMERRRTPRLPEWYTALAGIKLTPNSEASDGDAVESAAVRVRLVGARPHPLVEGIDPYQGHVNYLIGSDKHNWHRNVSTFGGVRYRSVYPGVDVIYYATDSALEYDMIVAPGADASAIKVALDGASRARLDKSGNLVMTTPLGLVSMRRPVVYQEDANGLRHKIDAHYVAHPASPKDGESFTIALAGHDPARPLVIDPQLAYSSYLGGNGLHGGTVQGFAPFQLLTSKLPSGFAPSVADLGLDVTVGTNNIAYVAGLAYSTNFPVFPKPPTKPPAYQVTNKGNAAKTPNAFVAAFNTTKSGAASLVFSTYLGGSGCNHATEPKCGEGTDGDEATGIAVDGGGNAYVVGITYSTNFPTTSNAFQKTIVQKAPNVNNGFASILSENGAELYYSSYINGDEGAPASRVALLPGCSSSPNCEMYIAGSSTTTDSTFMTTSTAYQETNPDKTGNSAAYVMVLDPALAGTKGLEYSTFLGGSGKDLPPTTGGDGATGIAVDSEGLIYLTGFAFSSATPPTGKTDCGTGVKCQGFPVTTSPAAYQKLNNANNNNESNAFVSVIEPTKSGAASLVYSSYLGGSGNPSLSPGSASDLGVDITLEPGASREVWVTGLTFSSKEHAPGFPTTTNAFQTDNNAHASGTGFSNAFITELNTSKSSTAGLLYSTYLGGSGFVDPLDSSEGAGDAATGIRVDKTGQYVYVTGGTASNDIKQPSGNIGCQKSDDGLAHITFFALNAGNAFLVELKPALAPASQELFFTYFGGSVVDIASSLALDASNNVYITGLSSSPDTPVTGATAYQKTNNAYSNTTPGTGVTNAFLTEFDVTSKDCTDFPNP